MATINSFIRRPLTRRSALTVLAGGAVGLLAACGGAAKLTGTDLGKTPAPDFTLTDQRGETVKLSSYRGKAVVLTFIYTNCPDVCPLTANELKMTNDQLTSTTRDKVAFMAITVDPLRDTATALQQFSEEHGLASDTNWHALRGSEQELAPVWQAYNIDPGQMVHSPEEHGAPLNLAHTDAIYVIDPQGRERVLLHSDTIDPKKLASDLKTLVE